MANNAYSKVYTSFSGADILVSVGNQVMGELQGISYSVTREKAPLYTLGSPDPRAFSRGKRGISGSLIFLVFNRSPLPFGIDGDTDARKFIADPNEKSLYGPREDGSIGSGSAAESLQLASQNQNLSNYTDFRPAKAWYADQLPPFDALVRAVNEYGHAAQMEILGIEILNTGSGMSVDDITIDESHTYVARRVKKWYRQARYEWGDNGNWNETANDYVSVSY